MYDLNSYRDSLNLCSRCGACGAVCPVYQVSREECLLSRGRLNLVEATFFGDLPFTKETEKRLNACLLCGACADACPASTEADKIFLNARIKRVDEYGLPFAKNLAFNYLIPSSWRFNMGLKTLSYLQKLLPFDDKDKSEYRHLPFSMLGFSNQFSMPPIASKTLTQRWSDITVRSPRSRVAFFAGCLIEYVYPEIGLALQNILTKLNIEVIKPHQVCCSTPILCSGDVKSAARLAADNVRNFLREDIDYIVTACASCGSALKKHYPQLLKESMPEVVEFTDIIRDSTEFLVKETKALEQLKQIKKQVTYHDPCHLGRHQRITEQPRTLIRAAGAELTELAAPDRCCGNGGTFSLYYPELSQDILTLKTRDIIATEAEQVITSCPGCLMQLRRGLDQTQSTQEPVHILEFLNNRLK